MKFCRLGAVGIKGVGALAVALSAFAPAGFAGELVINVGPPAVGAGGPNPVSIPPINPAEYQIAYATDHDWETSVSASPGLFFGRKSRTGSVYVGMGGGLVIDANGSGPGVDASLGYEAGKGVKFNAELRQAIGYSFGRRTVLSPYAIRLGVAFEF